MMLSPAKENAIHGMIDEFYDQSIFPTRMVLLRLILEAHTKLSEMERLEAKQLFRMPPDTSSRAPSSEE